MKAKLIIFISLFLLLVNMEAKSEVWYYLEEGVTPNNGASGNFGAIIIVKDNAGVYWYARITGRPSEGYTGEDTLRAKLRSNADHYVNWFNHPSSNKETSRFCMENNNYYDAFSFNRIDDLVRNSKSYSFYKGNFALSLDYKILYVNVNYSPSKFNMYQLSDFEFNPDSLF